MFYTSYGQTHDGISWTEVTVSDSCNTEMWNSICYGNGLFIAITDENRFAYSYNGITWNTGILTEEAVYNRCICYGDNKFIVGADSGIRVCGIY